MAQEGLCARLGVQAISTAHRVGAATRTSENFSQIHNDVQNTHTLSVSLTESQPVTNTPEHNPQLQYTSVCYNICLPAIQP